MLLGHYIIISIFLGRRPNVQDFNVSKQPCGVPTVYAVGPGRA